MLDFSKLGLFANLGIFAISATAVWFAGTRMSHYASAISDKTGVGHALVGLVLLAGVTSLPEIAVTVSASTFGNADLAVNNLFGSIAMQVAALAAVDFASGRRALTAVVPEPSLLLLGALNVLLLSIAAAAIVVGDVAVLGVGLWAWLCLGAYIASIWLLSNSEGRRPWRADEPKATARQPEPGQSAFAHESLRAVVLRTVIAGVVILSAGYLLARTGDAIAQQTGLGSSFVGFVLVAISTSLPEFSTALSAARLGLFTMAISDILGTNLINVGLVFVVDAVASGEAVLGRVGSFSAFGALLGIILTTLFVVGLVERRDRTLLRMGFDSIAVVIAYLAGVIVLFQLR